jgi:hypothetical protein
LLLRWRPPRTMLLALTRLAGLAGGV